MGRPNFPSRSQYSGPLMCAVRIPSPGVWGQNGLRRGGSLLLLTPPLLASLEHEENTLHRHAPH